MFDDYVVLKKMKRFKKDIKVLKKGNVTVKMVDDETYIPAYEKIWKMLENCDTDRFLNIDVTFISNEYISFIYKSDRKCFALNFSIVSGYFERESIVLKYANIRKKDILKIFEKNLITQKDLFSRVFLVPRGLGVVCDDTGERVIKIRR